MKKVIWLLVLSSLSISASRLTQTYWSGDTKMHRVTCSNGKNVIISYYPKADRDGANAYYGKNTTYKTLSQAVSSKCSTNKSKQRIGTLKKGSLICAKEHLIKSSLRSKLAYSTADFSAGRGEYKNCFNAQVNNMKAILLKHYKQEKKMIDGYYKINGNGDIYYTREDSFL